MVGVRLQDAKEEVETMTVTRTERQLRLDVRYDIISKMDDGSGRTAEQVAEVLHLTVRQVFRLKAKIKAAGRTGLIHGNTGRKPASALSDQLRHRVVDLYDTEFAKHDYNYAHFTDALAEEYQILISRETVRYWLREANLGHKAKRYYQHRLKRERKARMGQLLFLDGSPHRWFGSDYPRSTLILATDDATGEPLYGILRPHEDRNGCFAVMYNVVQQRGLPETLYLDRGSIFKTTRHGGIHAEQTSEDETAFQIAMRKLGVAIIFAQTPQARGRGERINGSFQGRLVAELSRQGIHDYEPANEYLNEQFIPRYRKRFAVAPRDPKMAFRPVPVGLDLHQVLCKESMRLVHSDNTIRLNGRIYQLYPPRSCEVLYGATVTVQEWFDDTVHTYYKTVGEINNQLLPHLDIYRTINRHNCQRPQDKIKLPLP